MKQNPFRASIAPVPAGTKRPLWSVMVPTFHCAKYLNRALSSVLSQDPGNDVMEIEIIDDGSTMDNPAEVVSGLGRGRVGFYSQPVNVGHVKNFETCLNRSHGFLIHLLHGDDYVCEGFYQKMQSAFEKHPEIGAAFCRHMFIDDKGKTLSVSALECEQSGILLNGLELVALEQRIMTPSIVVRREVYERMGCFDRRLVCSEDWEMWVRIASQYPIWYETEVLAAYRIHKNSNTGRYQRNGADMKYTRKAIQMMKSYLPADRADAIISKSRAKYAFSALNTAESMMEERKWSAALAQIREALLLSFSPVNMRMSAQYLLRMATTWLRRS